jgi:hypothetical protein
VTDAASLGASGVLAAALPLAEELRAATPARPHLPVLTLSADRLCSAPEIFGWGATARLFDLVERHIGVPVAYHGVYLRRDRAGADVARSQQWHLDPEDRHVVKVIVYLTDVEDGDGAFEYIPRRESTELGRALGPMFKLGGDERMGTLVPKEYWRIVGGPAGTVVIADTAQLFHRGRQPADQDRLALFYDYTSRRPLHPYYCKSALPEPMLRELTAGMEQRVLDAVFWRPRLHTFDPAKHQYQRP